MANGILNKFQH